jgi:uncharacterized membrane protein (DUF4010 family)
LIPEPFLQLAVAFGLGLLVGLQRERMQSPVAGIRTFALITVLGTVAAQLGRAFGGWVVAVGLAAVAVLVIAGNLARLPKGEADPGQTTEFTALVMYGVGALVVLGPMAVPVVLGGSVALILQFKEELHRFAGRLGEEDLRAIMQFVLVALVILPVLPDRAFGPYSVLNPYQIWWMVVLIVGLSLAGYVAYKLFGAGAGAALSGVLGGMISSTATTVTYARRTREEPDLCRLAALVVMIASSVVYARLLVEIAAVAPRSFLALAPPIGVLLGLSIVLSVAAWLIGRDGEPVHSPQGNPAQLKSALAFGVLYGLVLLAVAFARSRFGTAGLYAVAGLSGLTDMDAITLSTARLVDGGAVAAGDGWRAILLASFTNLVFKAGVVAVLGTWRLFGRIAILFGLALAGGAAVWWLWPW